MATRKQKTKQPLTTAQQLGSLIKSARDIMRKDKGLNGDLDRLPMLTWVMFLKFFDDLEIIHEQKAALAGKPYKPIIQAPYRWRDWAAKEDGVSGDDLTHFINDQETVRPDGTKGAGLFQYLRQLRGADGGKDQRDVIANIFRGVSNRMNSGFLLREIVNKVNGIHFSSSEEIHTLSHLYESMLKEMRDAAGDSGEFYTPRAVVKFMVAVTNPRLGESVLDPACGTGGFLVEAFTHLSAQAKTVQHRRILQEESIFGGEAKPLPFLLAEMNLLLHGVESPQIDPRNSLITPLRDIGDKERVDIVLTNPPFGGEEEKGIQGNFPEDKQTAETALLFLMLIMRKLRRAPKPGRAGVVVPNGLLYGDGICARIKEELLKDFNLHTIIRLPRGVFSPYTPIPTNLLFFDRCGPTKDIWYYEQRLPDSRRSYTKTQPMAFEDLSDCLSWWTNRSESDRAWRVPIHQVLRYDDNGLLTSVNLDLRNPRGQERLEHLPPEQLVKNLASQQNRILDGLVEIGEMLGQVDVTRGWVETDLSEVLRLVQDGCPVDSQCEYPNFGIYSFGRGLFEKPPISGLSTSAKTLYRVRSGQFVYSRLFAFEGAYGVVSNQFDNYFVSNEYPTFECDGQRVLPEYLAAYFSIPEVWKRAADGSKGLGDRRQRVQPEQLLRLRVPLPPIQQQRVLAALLERRNQIQVQLGATAKDINALLPCLMAKPLRSLFDGLDQHPHGAATSR